MGKFKGIKKLIRRCQAALGAAAEHTDRPAGGAASSFITSLALVGALAAVASLGACGGEQQGADADLRASASNASVRAAGFDGNAIAGLLLDDEGNVMPTDPSALPADPNQRQQGLRYTTAAGAQALEESLGSRALHLALFDGGPATLQSALGQVGQAQGANPAPAELHVLISAPQLQHANDLALRMGALGISRVWVVTP